MLITYFPGLRSYQQIGLPSLDYLYFIMPKRISEDVKSTAANCQFGVFIKIKLLAYKFASFHRLQRQRYHVGISVAADFTQLNTQYFYAFLQAIRYPNFRLLRRIRQPS